MRIFNLPALQRSRLACLLQSAVELDEFEGGVAEDEVGACATVVWSA